MSAEGEGEVTFDALPVVPEGDGDAAAEVEVETDATPEGEGEQPAAEPAAKSTLDALLSGELPDDLAFYRDQALEAEPEFSAEDLESLGTRGKQMLAALLARAKKAEAEVQTFASEQDGKVTAATETLKAAQQERASALDWAQGEQLKAHRAQLAAATQDQTPLDPQDPEFLQKAIDRAVAAKMSEFFASIDADAQARNAAVAQTKADEAYGAYRTGYEQFAAAHKDELVVTGQKETVERWTGKHDAKGQPVMQQYVIEKRSPLAVRIEQVMDRYGPHPDDPRMYRMPIEQAYTLALHELSAENDATEHEASMKRARERVVPTFQPRKAPEQKPPLDDADAFAAFLEKNPDWVAAQNRRHFGE